MVVQGRINRYAKRIAINQRREMLRTGTLVRLTPSRRCSCLDESQQPSLDCRVCGGRGWFHRDEDERVVRAAIHDASLNRLWQGYGFIQQGDLGVTFDVRTYVKPYDRLRLGVDDLGQFNILAEDEVITHDPDGAGSLTDGLRHRIHAVRTITQTDAWEGTVIDYRPGIDFVAPPGDNLIVWQTGPGAVVPPSFAKIAVSYLADYDWICLQDASPRHVGGAGFGAPAFFSRQILDERAEDARRADIPV